MNQERDSLAKELDIMATRVKDVERERDLLEIRMQKMVEKYRDEIETANEKAMYAQKNATKFDIYKKKAENAAEIEIAYHE
jgi:hypothetical protein